MKKIFFVIVLTVSCVLLTNKQNFCYPQTKTETKQESILEDPSNQLGLIYWARKLEEATSLLKQEKIQEAEKILISTKEWLTDATEYHYNLFQSLSKNPKNINLSKIERAHAFDYGQIRDQSSYLLAQAYIKQNKLKEGVKLLVEIIKSQPDSELGHNAYKTLQDIKFSDKSKV